MRVKKAKSRIVFEIINYAILTILALICILSNVSPCLNVSGKCFCTSK